MRTGVIDDAECRTLEARATRVRRHVLGMAAAGGCFVGAALSCTDILVYLYSRWLRVGPDRIEDPDRDYLLLSKGHAVPALYGTLAELGFFPEERLTHHLQPNDLLYWHPNRALPGVEFHTGSLGHALSVGAGIAYDIRLRDGAGRVVVIVGDGELDEGSNWEALLVASALRLDNLVVVVDRNELQANVRTEDLIALEPLADKFAAFRWRVAHANGHDFESLDASFASVQPGYGGGLPGVVVAATVRGKGVPSIEGRSDRWFYTLDDAEHTVMLRELRDASRVHDLAEAGVR